MSVKTYHNTDDHARDWPHLTAPDGTTLFLKPGQTVELDLPDDFHDIYLKPVGVIVDTQTSQMLKARQDTTTTAEPQEPTHDTTEE